MKNRILLFLSRLFRKKAHPLNGRILIVSTTALGDTLWATPAIESLRKSFPQNHIAILTSPIGFEVLKNNPHIDELFLLEEPLLPRFFRLRKKLFQERFDTVLLFHASQRLTLPLCACIGASTIVGTASINKGLDSLLTRPLALKKEHEIARRLEMVKEIGGKIYTETLSFLPDRSSKKLPPGKWVAIHAGSKDGFKRWPSRHFIEVAQKLQKEWECQILFTGVAAEKKLLEELSSQVAGSLIATDSLHDFANLLTQVDLLISNDTGSVHLALSLNRPVIALYGPTDPDLCGPYKAKTGEVLSVRPTCTPCLKRKCPLPFCLLQISPEQVIQSAVKILVKNRPLAQFESYP
jgi:ADP-heptose:LPS heptosyltransferase